MALPPRFPPARAHAGQEVVPRPRASLHSGRQFEFTRLKIDVRALSLTLMPSLKTSNLGTDPRSRKVYLRVIFIFLGTGSWHVLRKQLQMWFSQAIARIMSEQKFKVTSKL